MQNNSFSNTLSKGDEGRAKLIQYARNTHNNVKLVGNPGNSGDVKIQFKTEPTITIHHFSDFSNQSDLDKLTQFLNKFNTQGKKALTTIKNGDFLK